MSKRAFLLMHVLVFAIIAAVLIIILLKFPVAMFVQSRFVDAVAVQAFGRVGDRLESADTLSDGESSPPVGFSKFKKGTALVGFSVGQAMVWGHSHYGDADDIGSRLFSRPGPCDGRTSACCDDDASCLCLCVDETEGACLRCRQFDVFPYLIGVSQNQGSTWGERFSDVGWSVYISGWDKDLPKDEIIVQKMSDTVACIRLPKTECTFFSAPLDSSEVCCEIGEYDGDLYYFRYEWKNAKECFDENKKKNTMTVIRMDIDNARCLVLKAATEDKDDRSIYPAPALTPTVAPASP